jgi:hypothetical protein
MLRLLILLWGISAVVAATLLSRSNHAGTGFLWGLVLGPVGLLIVLLQRVAWERRWERERLGGEEARKEQAWREWRGH